MLPKDNPKKEKSKKDSDKKKEEDKLQRRNSLTDNSSQSTSSSNSSSSSVDSDEASSSGIPDTKGTMTSSDMLDAPETSGLDGNLYRRPIRSDTPVQELARDIGFTSLSNSYPLANTQPHSNGNQSHRGGGASSGMIAESSFAGNRNKRGESTAKGGSKKKKREKKEKKEKDSRFRDNNSTAAAYEKILEMRNRHEQDRMRREVAQMYRLNEEPQTQEYYNYRQRPLSAYAKPYQSIVSQSKRITERDKLQATIGFGIAATGIYDKVPEMTGARGEVSTIYKGSAYSDLVGPGRVNWREAFDEQHYKEMQQYNHMNVEFDAVVRHRLDLRKAVDESVENKWIRNLLHLILDGDIKKVWRRVQMIQRVLQEHEGPHPYKAMGKTVLLELVMQGLVKLLVEPKDGFNVIMYLMSHSYAPTTSCLYKKPCFARNHHDCMLAELILSALPPVPARHLLSLATHQTKRRAIHFAAISGTPCQMDLLLKFDVDTNQMDISEQTPVHYAVARNNTVMLRQLMWHGTDMALFDPSRRYLDVSPDNLETCTFLRDRLLAMERCMSAWLKALCAGKWRLDMPISSLHCTRITSYGDSKDCYETGSTASKCAQTRNFRLAIRDETMRHVQNSNDSNIMLFVLPVMFTPYDPIMPAKNPHIVRTKLALENDCFQKAAAVMSQDPTVRFKCGGTVQIRDLPSAFHEKHNGYLYAWTFPKNIDENTLPSVTLHIDPSQLSRTVARHSILFIQAFSVTNLYTKQKCD